ncbi:Sulfotransferase domain containing protein [Parasponia andersonii]|uniref:Sulfotransferase n=1 Tax=Parasponia andersonii TaxID=3476 RepID=A0A2P5CBS5_PARAD|nr:Sulfotransferase domain containing protein [Parasponia andersonii]
MVHHKYMLALPNTNNMMLNMNPTSNERECDHQHDGDQLQLQLPKTKGWLGSSALSLYQGFWYPSRVLPNIMVFQKHFQPHNQDIILASTPKSGTTLLKALLFSIVNRARYTPSNTPLLTTNPHQLLPFLEFTLYADAKAPDLTVATPPRLFSTHIPYASLPESIKCSECRIVYICRNPLDVIVSFWHFATRDHPERRSLWTMEDYVDKFCKGEQGFGPFWDHVLGYWKESLVKPEKVLFLKYEEMKEDTAAHVKRIAEFIRFPFSEEEESKGVVGEISELCSLGTLRDLEVNKSGKFMPNFDNKSYFRKGEVGDWVNHLSSSMVERINKVIEEKLSGSGLAFKSKI